MMFLQPKTRSELTKSLKQMTEDSHLIAGCTDFLAERNGKCWDADLLVDLTAMKELKQVTLQEQGLSIGALCTHTQVEINEMTVQYFPALVYACGNVGSMQIRNRGTIGGSIGNASPAGDIYPVLLALQAEVEVLSSSGKTRRVPVEDVIHGSGKTCLTKDEAILSFFIPFPAWGETSAFCKLGERAKVTIAKINLTLAARSECGQLRDVRVALGAVAEKAFLSKEAAAVLEGAPVNNIPRDAFAETLSEIIRWSIPNRASMAYKQKAVKGLADDVIDLWLAQNKKKQ